MREEDQIVLWQRVKKNEKAAFNMLYQHTIDFIWAYGQRFTEDHNLVEESIQEVYVALWQKRHKINISTSFKLYLLQSFRRRLLKNLKKKRKLTILTFEAGMFVSPSYEEEWIEEEEQTIRYAQLKKATKTLSPRQQEALFLKFYQQVSSPDIARLMNLQIGAVYKLISTGLRRLKNNFE